ncbi:MAG: hypothetical protein WAV93_00145 [Bacteroidales bacterium]
MKKSPLAVLILTVGMMLCSLVGGQTPNGPVFIITMEQKGSVDDKAFKKTVEARYWPCAGWNSGYSGGMTYSEKSVMGAQMNASPEGLLAARGSIAAMKPGETMIFYVREKSGSGNDGVSSVTLSTVGDGVFSYTVVTENDTWTSPAGGPVTEPERRAFGPAGNTEAVIKRTVEGAILTFSELDLEGEGDSDFFGLFSQDNEPEEMPEALTFKLSNEDLKNWQTLQKVNNRTLNGAIEGSLGITATFRGGPISYAEAEVTLDGCSELGAGNNGKITASGKPEGGTYKFRVEPSDMMSVDAEGASATLTGSRPGRGTLYVEYTTPDGGKAEASQPASMISIYSYNGGDAIPQIPLYDIDGNKLPGKLTVPYSSEPDEANELVDFVSGNPSVFTVVASADKIDLQGSDPGKFTLEARDNCGNVTGPTVGVEVVNCDKETVEALERMRQAAIENLKAAAENLQKVAGSKEFEKATDDLPASAVELLAKAGLTIITSGKTSGAVKTASEIAEAGAAISELIGSANAKEFGINALKNALGQLGGDAVNTLIGITEVGEAGYKFGQNIAQIFDHENQLENALESWEKAYKDLQRIDRLQQLCRGDKTGPQKKQEPKADPMPKPTDPKPPVDPKPKTDSPPAKKPPTGDPRPPVPEEEEPPIPPTPPTGEPRQVGLPFSPEECGCDKSKSISVSSAGFSTLMAGVKNIGDCVEKFNSISVTDYSNALSELSALTDTLKSATDGNPSLFQVKAKEAKPKLDLLIERTKSYDKAGKTFMKEFEKCPESVMTGMDVLKSTLTVTVDSITTKY